MRKSLPLTIFIFISVLIFGASSCNKEDEQINTGNNTIKGNGKVKITVDSQTFTATLLDNNSAKAILEMLPMNIKVIELNSDEKYFDLPNNLPKNSSNPGTIKIGDNGIWFEDINIILQKLFDLYSYTKLGVCR